MGRPRKSDPWLPPRVYRGKSAFEFHPRSGGAIRLAPLAATQSAVWAAYEHMMAEQDGDTIKRLVHEFFESADFNDLSATTQKDYRKYSIPVIKVFGGMDPSRVESPHIRKYMDKRGQNSKVQANREKAFFSRVFRWAYERGKVKSNPCQGVRQFKEKARTRYITDLEFQAVMDAARPAVRVAMELSYLCAARKGDVLAMRWSQMGEEGITIQQSKTSKIQIKAWSPRLIAAIEQAKQLAGSVVRSSYVICKPNGTPYTDNGFNAAWREAVLTAREQTGWPMDFTFHDIKAKAISDVEGSSRDKQRISGHKTEAQVAAYDRSIEVVPAVDSVKKR